MSLALCSLSVSLSRSSIYMYIYLSLSSSLDLWLARLPVCCPLLPLLLTVSPLLCLSCVALAVLATRIDLLKEIIVSAAPTIGVYQFRFYKAGMWRVVSVDDHLPCSVSGGPIYGRCRDPNELWVSLVEKVGFVCFLFVVRVPSLFLCCCFVGVAFFFTLSRKHTVD
jgi:Calpain family cysteine protease